MLCSDGLTAHVEDHDDRARSCGATTIRIDAARELIVAANAGGGYRQHFGDRSVCELGVTRAEMTMATSPKHHCRNTGPLKPGTVLQSRYADRAAARRRRDGDGLSRARSAPGESLRARSKRWSIILSTRQQRIEANDYFAREADTLAQLKHQAIPAITDRFDAPEPPLPGDGVRRGAQPRRGARGARRAAARGAGDRYRAPACATCSRTCTG